MIVDKREVTQRFDSLDQSWQTNLLTYNAFLYVDTAIKNLFLSHIFGTTISKTLFGKGGKINIYK